MPDPALHGNGDPCPACEMRREAMAARGEWPEVRDCNVCAGTGRLPREIAVIVAETVAEARRLYWPAVEARWAAHNAKVADAQG